MGEGGAPGFSAKTDQAISVFLKNAGVEISPTAGPSERLDALEAILNGDDKGAAAADKASMTMRMQRGRQGVTEKVQALITHIRGE